MDYRTLKFGLQYHPANSQAIGYHATQQNAAYNHAADLLNREPHLPKRSGRNHPDALNKRITAWRQGNRQSADAPYHIHQQGSEEAWEANQRLQQSRAERLDRIARALAKDDDPKHRDTRPTAARWLTAPESMVASALPSPTGGFSKSVTTVRR